MIRFACYSLPLIALTGASPAFAEDWRLAATSGSKPDRAIYLLDASSIMRTGDTVIFKVEAIFESLSQIRDYDRAITKRTGTCKVTTSQILENSNYLKGSLKDASVKPGYRLNVHIGSPMHDVLQQACGIKPMREARILNPEVTIRAFFAK